ncbi:replication initiator [Streptomyces xinghaiensis]|uniref:replication initiator n=1 Tax=Streptomyces xinghaiensis TaxID=1038928 RepID=UPI0037B9F923
MRHLSDTDRDVIRVASDPLFPRWLEQVTTTGGCAHPVHLAGSTTTHDALTGELLHHYATADEPGERLLVRCRNRRATVCAPCSRLHAGDTFHLVRVGLTGGKNVPADVRDRPRVFLTLTAPGFGPVHRAADGSPCRPRRTSAPCEHGRPLRCRTVHEGTDPLVGQPLCPGCYDYCGHVLWHAYAGRLWKAFTDNLYHHLAARTGHTRSGMRRAVRLSYAKVAEYQKRAAVHVHAVVRLDGPGGPATPPPPWANADTLAGAVRTAAAAVRLTTVHSAALGEYVLRWGAQLDVRPLRAPNGPDGLTDEAVAAYVAKYVTKGAAETAAGLDHRVTSADELHTAPVSAHVRALMGTCWRLGGLPELEPLRLRAWAHALGYRGHVLTKSRAYSTTYAALRAERAEHERTVRGSPPLADVETTSDAHWRYVGSGHSPGAALIAAGIAEDLARNREIAREEVNRSGVCP